MQSEGERDSYGASRRKARREDPERPRPRIQEWRVGAAVEGAADGLDEGIERHEAGPALRRMSEQVGKAAVAVTPDSTDPKTGSSRRERLRAKMDRVDEKVTEVVDGTRVKARAVAETVRRGKDAPPKVAEDVKEAAKAYATGMVAGLGLYIAAGVLALAAAVVLTVACVQGLNRAWGAPWGTFTVAAVYAVLTAFCYFMAKGRAEAGREEAKGHLSEARDEIRHVTLPVRQAFGSRGQQTFSQRRTSTEGDFLEPAGRPGDSHIGTTASYSGEEAPQAREGMWTRQEGKT
jgi:hypothetical protein